MINSMDLEGSSPSLIEMLSGSLPEMTENYEKPAQYLPSRPSFRTSYFPKTSTEKYRTLPLHQRSGPYSPYGRWPLFQFLNPCAVSRTPWVGDQFIVRLLPTHRTTQTQNKRTLTSIP
jgi:hypothetical protein